MLNLADIWEINADSKPAPFSFVYDGKHSSEFISDWKCEFAKISDDGKILISHITYSQPSGPLRILAEITEYKDFPAVEWVLYFENASVVSTAIIEDIQAVSYACDCIADFTPTLTTLRGSESSVNDFAPQKKLITPGYIKKLHCVGGRSSSGLSMDGDDSGVFPFFDVELGDGLLICSVGWSGQWQARVNNTGDKKIHVEACMPGVHTKLLAGEKIRTPKILFYFDKESPEQTRRGFRRFMLEHKTPTVNGKPITHLPIAACSWFMHNCGNEVSEQNQIEFMDYFVNNKIGINTYWLDAGWYDGMGDWCRDVGNWTPKVKNFPDGLQPVAARAKENNLGFVLWFEPERVCPNTWLAENHPEWLIPPTDDFMKLRSKIFYADYVESLLDFGNTQARQWLIGHVSDMIEKEGITVYRQDFNFDPLSFWESADGPDRKGIAQIRYIEGLYEFWDELRCRHPHILIDNCASGGRRIDIETCVRSVSLHRTDCVFKPDAAQAHTIGLNHYIPLHSTCIITSVLYDARSTYSAGLSIAESINADTFNIKAYQRMIAEYLKVRHLFTGDFHALTSYSTADDVWCGYEYFRKDLDEGVAMFFRREKSPHESGAFKLILPENDKTYSVENLDTGIVITATGKELSEDVGIQICLKQRESALLHIRLV